MRIIVSRPQSIIGGNYLLFYGCGSMAAVRWTENRGVRWAEASNVRS